MNCKTTSFSIAFYPSVNKTPANVWNDLSFDDSPYFEQEYLLALEENHDSIKFFYAVVFNREKEAIAFACIQIVDFYPNTILNDWQSILKKIASIARKIRLIPKEKPLKILNCGNLFVSGNHGVYLKETTDKKTVFKFLLKKITKHFQSNRETLVDIFIIKDFTKDEAAITNELISLGYYAFNVEPNMKLTVKPEWKNFDDYLQSLKTKFRVKAKKAIQLSSKLEISWINNESLPEDVLEMTTLYKKVTSRAGFNFSDFNLATYLDLKKNFKDDYFIKTYRLNSKLIGFMSGLKTKHSIDAHFVGIDYAFNKQYAVYQRMLYDYISLAIESKVKKINYGRTASEIKSSVGATPEHLTVYIRHKKNLANKFLKLFLLHIQPSEFNQKYPFKNQL